MDTVVPSGLFLVTAVLAPGIKFAVVQFKIEPQVDELLAMVQEVAERVPEGELFSHAWVLQLWELSPEQSAPPPDGAGLVQVRV